MNVAKAIRSAVDTGKVVLGERETLRFLKKIRLAIVASNCKASSTEELRRQAEESKIWVYEFPGSSVELGSVCGKPYVVSMLGVLEAGESDIFELSRR